MSSLLIYCVLLICYVQDGTCCQQNQFLYEGNCCDMCPAGTYLDKYCGASTQTKCEICREGTFTDQIHNLKICYPCQNCIGGKTRECYI
ncbi:tumor necrosis factor receptor superfamily member 5-like [Stegostoma tigrinum]|uniref:tumor necrosis factor receptor superfamily member 5-like n=1 Tax=Stegostoma tigrinum TaxID=3053191 RepID=UPI0028706730|nr:tumor necrosis factor receptor superfamily member 5-like [Stegostoma tigrinum]